LTAAGLLALAVAGAACGQGATSSRADTTSPASAAPSTTTAPTPTTTTGAAAAWTTYGDGGQRQSAAPSFPSVTHTPAEAWTSAPLDGAVYGQPLVFDGQVLVATEADTVYGLDAATGSTSWSVHLGTPVPADALPCGDITPEVGVTSTMVVDPASGTLFASAETDEAGTVHHVLAAISTSAHRVLWTADLDQPGWSAAAQLQRAALALADGLVLVGFGGNYGDCGSYHGWVLGVPVSGAGATLVYRVPTANQGAVWAPGGVTVDPGGAIYAATGNGSAGPGQAFDHGNAVVALSPTLTETGYFAPAQWAQENAADADLGSTAPISLGDGRLFIVGKQATGYLLQGDALGGIGHPLAAVALCNSRGANAYDAPALFVVCTDEGSLVRVVVGPGDTLTRGWSWRSPTGGAGSPTVAGGVVWSVDPGASVLYGIDESSGATRYAVTLGTGTPTHFAAVTAADGLLIVAGSSAVEALH